MGAQEEEIAKRIFREIIARFPHLKFALQEEPDKQAEVRLELPRQEGLAFDVTLRLQFPDELILDAGSGFTVAWFPCTDTEAAKRYKDAVAGLLAGDHRIREHHRRGEAVKAELQSFENGEWKTFAESSTLHIPLPWRKTYVILQNRT